MSKTQKIVAINYAAQVDRLGELHNLVAPLHDEINAIKADLRASGYDIVEGRFYRCTIGKTDDKEYVDWQAVATTGVRKDRLATLVDKFTSYKQALGAVRCVAKVR